MTSLRGVQLSHRSAVLGLFLLSSHELKITDSSTDAGKRLIVQVKNSLMQVTTSFLIIEKSITLEQTACRQTSFQNQKQRRRKKAGQSKK